MGLTFSASGDSELSMTLHNRRAEIVDNIFQGTPFLNMMKSRNGIEIDSTGGNSIVRGVRFSKNGTADSFSGFDTFVVSPQDNETSLSFPWASIWAHIAIAWDESIRNSGQARLINLVNQKIDDAEMALKDELNQQLLAVPPTASGNKDLTSLRELIDNDNSYAQPARANSIGGINQNTNTWWRNKTVTTPAALSIGDMHSMYNDVSDGSDTSSFIITEDVQYEIYEAAGADQIRYAPADVMDQSFQALLYKTIPIVWDPLLSTTAANQMFFVNTNYTKLVIHSEAQFVTSDFIEADNGASMVAKILMMGQLISTNRRRDGVLEVTTA